MGDYPTSAQTYSNQNGSWSIGGSATPCMSPLSNNRPWARAATKRAALSRWFNLVAQHVLSWLLIVEMMRFP